MVTQQGNGEGLTGVQLGLLSRLVRTRGTSIRWLFNAYVCRRAKHALVAVVNYTGAEGASGCDWHVGNPPDLAEDSPRRRQRPVSQLVVASLPSGVLKLGLGAALYSPPLGETTYCTIHVGCFGLLVIGVFCSCSQPPTSKDSTM